LRRATPWLSRSSRAAPCWHCGSRFRLGCYLGQGQPAQSELL
jgi:hypothetical protein